MRTLEIKIKCEENIILQNKRVFIDGELLEYNQAEDCYKVEIKNLIEHRLIIEVSRFPDNSKNVRWFNNYYIDCVIKSDMKRKKSLLFLEIKEEEINDTITQNMNKYATNIKIIEYKINKLRADFSSLSSVFVESCIGKVFDKPYKKFLYILKYNILFIIMFLAGLSILGFLLFNLIIGSEPSLVFMNASSKELSNIDVLLFGLAFIGIPLFNSYHFVKFNKKVLLSDKIKKTQKTEGRG